ncbi:MAG: type II toxin-antitoxin system death-on-curing family toxin [Balneolales bacterium]
MKFLTKKLLLYFHQDQIAKFGGSQGIIDENLLESALGQPLLGFGGEYFCKDEFEMAASYGYHLCLNHPFVDGNKRMTLLSMYTFLYMNGWQLSSDPESLYLNIMALAQNKITKDDLAGFLKRHSVKIESEG